MTQALKEKYHVLTRGIILFEDHLLVAHCIGMDNTFLPGGHVEFHEGMRASLTREIEEELGLVSTVHEYLGAIEAAYEYKGTYHQEVTHFFSVEIEDMNILKNPESKESHLEFYWIHVDETEVHNLQPYPVRKMIKDIVEGNKRTYFESTFELESNGS